MMADGVLYVETFVDEAGEFRWRAIAHNYEVLSSSEGYGRARDRDHNIVLNFGDGVDVRPESPAPF